MFKAGMVLFFLALLLFCLRICSFIGFIEAYTLNYFTKDFTSFIINGNFAAIKLKIAKIKLNIKKG